MMISRKHVAAITLIIIRDDFDCFFKNGIKILPAPKLESIPRLTNYINPEDRALAEHANPSG